MSDHPMDLGSLTSTLAQDMNGILASTAPSKRTNACSNQRLSLRELICVTRTYESCRGGLCVQEVSEASRARFHLLLLFREKTMENDTLPFASVGWNRDGA